MIAGLILWENHSRNSMMLQENESKGKERKKEKGKDAEIRQLRKYKKEQGNRHIHIQITI